MGRRMGFFIMLHLLNYTKIDFIDNSTLALYGEPALKKRFLNVYQPEWHQLIDNTMMPLKHYMPKKPVKQGFKIWMRADGEN